MFFDNIYIVPIDYISFLPTLQYYSLKHNTAIYLDKSISLDKATKTDVLRGQKFTSLWETKTKTKKSGDLLFQLPN